MHELSTSFVLGYHGCSAAVAARVLSGEAFKPSQNEYDWLGTGIYFWEANPRRGLEFYAEACHRKGKDPADATVVGAVIDLGYCLDLASSRGTIALREAYKTMKSALKDIGEKMPKNYLGADLVRRKLDCAVINSLHQSRADNSLAPFDSVRGIFQEGNRIYPSSGFRNKTHTQIAVRSAKKIKGVFRVSAHELAESD